jgi:Tfp pilus assembly protein PilF
MVRPARRRIARVFCCLGLAPSVFGCALSRPDPRSQALLLASKGSTDAATEVLEKHLQKAPGAVPERRLLARLYASEGQLGRAQAHIAVLSRQLGPASPVPWVELGRALELAHRYDEALAEYDQAALAAPLDPTGPLTGGLRAARWGEAGLAEPRLVEALRRDPRNVDAWHALGMVRVRLGDLSGAEAAYRSGLAVDAGALQNHVGLATIAIVRGDARAALAEYDWVIAARPSFGDAYLGRAWALMKLGREAEARVAVERGAELGADRRSLSLQRRALDNQRLRSQAQAPER